MIRLQRQIAVQTFDAEATVAMGRERPEFLAVAQLAADLGRPVDGSDISRELLGSSLTQVGWRVVERCVALGLLERPGNHGPAALSESGRVALEHGAVLVPEEGSWRFYLVDDPLVDDPLVHIVRLELPRATDERKELKEARRENRPRADHGQPAPEPLAKARHAGVVHIDVSSGRAFEVREVAQRGLSGPRGSIDLLLEWRDPDPPAVVLRGHLAPASEDRGLLPVDRKLGRPRALEQVTFDSLWKSLVEAGTGVPKGELEVWIKRSGQKLVPAVFADLDAAARKAMRRDVAVPAPTIDRLGRFDKTTLEQLSLVPCSQEDAQQWAEWLLWESVGDYVTPALLRGLAKDAGDKFPFHELRLPEPERLLMRAREAPLDGRARFLLAPSDLGLWR